MAPQQCIAHFDLDTFFVSVERLKNPELVGKPLLVGGSMQRGIVSACSYEARKYGVHSAMPMHMALKLCPHAIVVKGDMSSYSHYSHWVTKIIVSVAPLVQKASIDEFYIDLTGMDDHFSSFQFIQNLKNRITCETGLPISFALASTKIISKIATNECKPNGELQILPGTEKTFLSPLPIEKVPMIGEKTAELLHKSGIRLIGDLINRSLNDAEKLLGKNGVGLWRRLNGFEASPVIPYREPKSISSENTFLQDTVDKGFMMNELVRLTEKVCLELRNNNKKAGCIGIKIKYSTFRVAIHQRQTEHTSFDHIVIQTVKELFSELYISNTPIRLLGVRLSSFTDLSQLHLFTDNNNMPCLYKTVDKMKDKYGYTIIQRASSKAAVIKDKIHSKIPIWFNRNVR